MNCYCGHLNKCMICLRRVRERDAEEFKDALDKWIVDSIIKISEKLEVDIESPPTKKIR